MGIPQQNAVLEAKQKILPANPAHHFIHIKKRLLLQMSFEFQEVIKPKSQQTRPHKPNKGLVFI